MTKSARAKTRCSATAYRGDRISGWLILLMVTVCVSLGGFGQPVFALPSAAGVQESNDDQKDEQGSPEADANATDDEPAATMAVSIGEPGESDRSMYELVGTLPDWVTQGNHIDPDSGASLVIVKSQPRLKQREAEEELEELLVRVVQERVDDLFAPGAGKAIGIDMPFIQEHLIQKNEECHADGVYHQLLRWNVPESNREMLGSSQRDAYQCFAQLRIDREFENRAEKMWEEQLVVSRTMQTGLIALSMLLVLGLVFGYLSADHKTRGFYSRRLQTIGLAFLLMGGAVVWWLATRFAWL